MIMIKKVPFFSVKYNTKFGFQTGIYPGEHKEEIKKRFVDSAVNDEGIKYLGEFEVKFELMPNDQEFQFIVDTPYLVIDGTYNHRLSYPFLMKYCSNEVNYLIEQRKLARNSNG